MVKLRSLVLLALLLSGFLSGCNSGPSEEDKKEAAEKAAAAAAAAQKAYLHFWTDCLGPSFRTALTHVPTRSEASDFALLTCKSDEDNFRAVEGPTGQARFQRERARVQAAMIDDKPFDDE